MHDATPSPAGLRLLDRRRFIAGMAGGMAGVALGSMLAEAGALEGVPHHPPQARRVVHFFCAGAVSHLDTWDYKPELVKRHGQPMPGAGKLVTFQGENGDLARPQWPFKPRGQSGKMVSG